MSPTRTKEPDAERSHDETTSGVPLREQAPVRTCVGCRRRRPRRELLRLARTPDGVRVDVAARLPGRGAYLCPDLSCIDRAARRGGDPVRRALREGSRTEILAALEHLRDVVRQPAPDDDERPPAPKEPRA